MSNASGRVRGAGCEGGGKVWLRWGQGKEEM